MGYDFQVHISSSLKWDELIDNFHISGSVGTIQN
jgi:hypothetical protein